MSPGEAGDGAPWPGFDPERGARESRRIIARWKRQVAAQLLAPLGPQADQRLRRLRLGLKALAGRDGGGWFIPYRHARPGRRPAYPALEPVFGEARPRMQALLQEITRLRGALRAIPPSGPDLRWGQEWFPRLDAAAAYAMIRRLQPARIIECGSGHSTRFMARALADMGADPARILAIDPAPRAGLGRTGARHLAALAEDVDRALFAQLEPGDVLFIDSSHIAMPGSDVDALFLDVLPRLQPGVYVHVHDVFLPEPYPESWSWRGYNEQLLVGALLQGGGYELAFASRWATRHMAAEVQAAVGAFPLPEGAPETSLWLRKLR
ncbi:class I SAM-dependent methyltransferase [Camelimonas abortus]|uniref:Class I SAM-dependent methyltransferase n=1 Tax=Camelimonas abortus TaxID=1017184 RepID=A0ABV7LDJ9_9HYPH